MGLLSSQGQGRAAAARKCLLPVRRPRGPLGVGAVQGQRQESCTNRGPEPLANSQRPHTKTLSQRSVLGGTPPEPRGPRERRSGRGLSLPAAAAATQYEDETRGHLTARS